MTTRAPLVPSITCMHRSPGVMVGDISITSHLYPDIPSILFKPKHPLGQVGIAIDTHLYFDVREFAISWDWETSCFP